MNKIVDQNGVFLPYLERELFGRLEQCERQIAHLVAYVKKLHRDMGHIGIPEFDPGAERAVIRDGDIYVE